MQIESMWGNFVITISWSTRETPKIMLSIIFIRVLKGLNYSNLLSGHAFFRMMNIRDEYLIHKTHRTFRAWLLPFSLVGGQP
jgi:hypothetical protein